MSLRCWNSLWANKIVPIVLFFTALGLYSILLSQSFEEWDSVQFALGVVDFDVAKHQPHPPGYPVYVFLSWIVYEITNQMTFSLAIVSAVSGAAAIVPFYYLGKDVFDHRIALISSLLLIFNPAYWLSAEKTLSDTLATSLAIWSVWMLCSGLRAHSHKRMYISSVLLGLSMGARQALFPFAATWIVLLWKDRRVLASNFLVFTLTCLGWFVPMVYKTGLERYVMTSSAYTASSIRMDSVFNPSMTFLDALKRVFYEYLAKDYLWRSFGAIPHLEPYYLKLFSVVVLGILLWLSLRFVLNLRREWNFKTKFILLLLLPYSIWMILVMTPYNDRYVLPTIPWLCLLLGWILMKNNSKHHRIRTAIILSLVLMTFVHSAYYANILHSVSSPPTQLVNYVAAQYDPTTTIILCSAEKRYFDYYHPEYSAITVYDPAEIDAVISKFNGTILITDYIAQTHGVKLGIESRLKLVAVFERDTLAHRRNWRIMLYEYERPSAAPILQNFGKTTLSRVFVNGIADLSMFKKSVSTISAMLPQTCESDSRKINSPEFSVMATYDPSEAAAAINAFNGTILVIDQAAQRLESFLGG